MNNCIYKKLFRVFIAPVTSEIVKIFVPRLLLLKSQNGMILNRYITWKDNGDMKILLDALYQKEMFSIYKAF